MGQTTFSGPVRSLAGFNPSGFNSVVNLSGSGVTTAAIILTVLQNAVGVT